MHLVPEAQGEFVSKVKSAYNSVLDKYIENCCETDIFQSTQSHAVIEYVRKTYGYELQYLWEKFPENTVFRRKDTARWYGALLVLSRRKLGYDYDGDKLVSYNGAAIAYNSLGNPITYRGCLNNPVMNIDPNGTWSWKGFWNIVAAVAVVVAIAAAVAVTAGAAAVALGAGASVAAGITIGAAVGGAVVGSIEIANQVQTNGDENLNIGSVAISTFYGALVGATVAVAVAVQEAMTK